MNGRRVLKGLSYAETMEFEELEARPPTDDHGNLMEWETGEGMNRA